MPSSRIVTVGSVESNPVRIAYTDSHPSSSAAYKGTILLIHGFPQTSYQFRHVIPLLSDAGYWVIAPDYRGTGQSSRIPAGPSAFRKTQMAADLHTLLHDHLGVKGEVHVMGHDIGGMIAHAYAARFPDDTASVIWGECPLPGTSFYDEVKGTVGMVSSACYLDRCVLNF